LKFTQDASSITFKKKKEGKFNPLVKKGKNKAKDYTVAGTAIFDVFPAMHRINCYNK